MQLTCDFHTHTTYSHGKGSVLDNAMSAKEKGIEEIAITDHGFSHPAFGLRRREVPSLRKDIEEAKKQTGVNVLLGIESNLRSIKGITDLTEKDYENFDVFLVGIHRFILFSSIKDWNKLFFKNFFTSVFKNKPSQRLIKDTTTAYINTIKNNPIDCITHLNYLCFADAVEVAKCCRDYGTYLEISSKKVHLSDEELFKVAQTGVRFIINSDAHTSDRVGDTKIVDEMIARTNFDTSLIDNIDGRKPTFRFKEYKQRKL